MNFVLKFSSYFEHECSLNKVLYSIEVTSKHCLLQCENCHKKYFYRLVETDRQIYDRLKSKGYV